jgi:hypothetical protein
MSPRGSVGPVEREYPPDVGHALELPGSVVDEPESRTGHQVAHGARYEDLTSRRAPCHPGRDVYRDAGQFLAGLLALATARSSKLGATDGTSMAEAISGMSDAARVAGGANRCAQLVVVRGTDTTPDRRDERRVSTAVVRSAVSDHGAKPTDLGEPDRLRGESRLADTGLTGHDDHRAAAAGRDLGSCLRDRCHVGRSPD